jgi:hypothetical protein
MEANTTKYLQTHEKAGRVLIKKGGGLLFCRVKPSVKKRFHFTPIGWKSSADFKRRIRLALSTFGGLGRGLRLARIPLVAFKKSNLGCISFIAMEPTFLVTRRWKIFNNSQLNFSSGKA